MSAVELATPEHDKLLAEHELHAALDRVFAWMVPAFRAETKELFSQLGEQANARPCEEPEPEA